MLAVVPTFDLGRELLVWWIASTQYPKTFAAWQAHCQHLQPRGCTVGEVSASNWLHFLGHSPQFGLVQLQKSFALAQSSSWIEAEARAADLWQAAQHFCRSQALAWLQNGARLALG